MLARRTFLVWRGRDGCCAVARRVRAGLSEPHHQDHRADAGRRPGRHHGAARRQCAAVDPRAAGRDREPGRRRQHARLQSRSRRRPGRLHAELHRGERPDHEPDAVQERGLHRGRLRAGRDRQRDAAGVRRQSQRAVQVGGGAWSPTPRPTRASSTIPPAAPARCRISPPNCSRSSPARRSPTCPTRAAGRRWPTSSAARCT